MVNKPAGDRLFLSPLEPLVAGGPAEAFETQLRQLYRSGHRQLVIDLTGVSMIDSAGIRALVRGHTTAQRVQGTLRLAALKPKVRETLDASHLGGVFDIYESAEAARLAAWPWRSIRIAIAGTALCGGLVWAGIKWPAQLAGIDVGTGGLTEGGSAPAVPHHVFQPFLELVKLIVSGLI